MMSETLKNLSCQLVRLSENNQNFYAPAWINLVNYLSNQFNELDRRRKLDFFINSNNNHWSTQKNSFFKPFNNTFSAESTDKEILANLVRGLAKKIDAINLELYSKEALDSFITNVTGQIDLFKNSFQKNHVKSPVIMNSGFLSDFRKKKDFVKKPDIDNNFNIQLSY